MNPDLLVTIWPSFPHFDQFADDRRLAGIRLNSAMISNPELEQELELLRKRKPVVPLYFDVKGRQLRVDEVHFNKDYLDVTLNHPITLNRPAHGQVVLFKAAADFARLDRIEEDGRRLVFIDGPEYMVEPGESIHIRQAGLQVRGQLFTDAELAKIDKVRKWGFKRYFLSYVESQRDVDQFLELVGRDAEVWLKIENKNGLNYVARGFRKQPNLVLVAARGDLYVEVDKPHDILPAMKLIIEKDPQACVGSRMLLSVVQEPVPSCADFHKLAWLYDVGYRRMMLCDELCLKGDLLTTAVNAFDSFRNTYAAKSASSQAASTRQQRNLLQQVLNLDFGGQTNT